MATVQVRMYEATKEDFDDLSLEINEARTILRKPDLTNAQLLHIAVDLLKKHKKKAIQS